MSRSLTIELPDDRPASETRQSMRRVLRAFLFGQGWGVLVSGACWICFAQDMGLKDSRFVWGLLAAIPWFATLMQLAGSYVVERAGRRKPAMIVSWLTSRWTWAAMAAMPLLLANHPKLAVACVLLLFMLHQSANAFGMPAWSSWMADVIPQRTRGRFFGLRSQIGPLVALPVALLAGWLLESAKTHTLTYPLPVAYSWPWNWPLHAQPFSFTILQLCTVFFSVGAVLGTLDIMTFRHIPDRAPGPPKHLPSLRQLLIDPLRNRSFRRFLTFYAVLWLAVPGIGNYVWLYVMDKEGVGVGPLWAQAIFFGGGQIGAILFCGLWGRFIDRFGRKTTLLLACAVPALLPVLYGTIQPGFWWLGFLVAFIDMATWTGVDQVSFNGVLHYSTSEQNTASASSYQAVFAVALAITGSISGIFFGLLAKFVNGWTCDCFGCHLNYFHIVFLAATLIRIAVCFTILPRVDNDSPYPLTEAIAYVVRGGYDNLRGLAGLPGRAWSRLAGLPKASEPAGKA